MKDTKHMATCLARHGAKADYLRRRRGGVKWSDVVRQLDCGHRYKLQETLKGCRVNETKMMTCLFNVLELKSPDDIF